MNEVSYELRRLYVAILKNGYRAITPPKYYDQINNGPNAYVIELQKRDAQIGKMHNKFIYLICSKENR